MRPTSGAGRALNEDIETMTENETDVDVVQEAIDWWSDDMHTNDAEVQSVNEAWEGIKKQLAIGALASETLKREPLKDVNEELMRTIEAGFRRQIELKVRVAELENDAKQEWLITEVRADEFVAKLMCTGSEPPTEAVLRTDCLLGKEREMVRVGSVYKCEFCSCKMHSYMTFEHGEGWFKVPIKETSTWFDADQSCQSEPKAEA